MAADGMPEPAIRRCGAAIARLRTLRGWSRAKLIARLYDQIDPTAPVYDRISIAWLARLEQGRVVKLSRAMLDALCHALECSSHERIELLLLADRNTIDADRAPTTAALAIAYTAAQLYDGAYATIAELIGSRSLDAIGDLDLLEIAAASLQELIIRRRGIYDKAQTHAQIERSAARSGDHSDVPAHVSEQAVVHQPTRPTRY
ncbi:MAG: helix-turn-helix transcriptional regulator [Roseiflexaceae bacterium]